MADITVSDELAARIESRIEHTEFGTPSEYAEFVLSEVLARSEHDSVDTRDETASRKEVQDRLQSLGYLEE